MTHRNDRYEGCTGASKQCRQSMVLAHRSFENLVKSHARDVLSMAEKKVASENKGKRKRSAAEEEAAREAAAYST